MDSKGNLLLIRGERTFHPGPELNAILSAQEDFLQVAVQEAVQWILEVELEECLRRRL